MTTYVDAYDIATGPSDEVSMVGKPLFYFGLDVPQGNTPLEMGINRQVNQAEKLGQAYPSISSGNFPADKVSVNAILSNGVPFYAVNGKSTTVGSVHTVTQLTTTQGIKERYNCVQKIGSLNPHIVHATMFHDLNVRHIVGMPAVYNMQGKGYKQHITAETLETPTYPSSISDPFNITEYFKWGANGSESTFGSVSVIDFKQTQAAKCGIGDDGYYTYIDDWAPIFSGLSVTFEGEESGVWADSIAGTKRSALWKCSKGSDTSKFFEVDSNGNNAICQSLTPIKRTNSVVIWNAVFTFENPNILITDGVANSFYGV